MIRVVEECLMRIFAEASRCIQSLGTERTVLNAVSVNASNHLFVPPSIVQESTSLLPVSRFIPGFLDLCSCSTLHMLSLQNGTH